LTLSGWVVTPAQPRATVALFHGLRDNRSKMLNRIAFLTAAGYRCVAFDHRGHGLSQGRKTSFGYFESLDAAAVLDFVRRSWPHQAHAALGVSMGAAALCFSAGRARHCQAVILESMYHDLAGAFQGRLGRGYPPWFSRFRRGIIWVTERRLGVRLAQVAPVRHVQELAPAPVLLITGSEDPHAPPDDVERLHEACAGPREFAVIPGAGHADVCETGAASYHQLVLNFLQRRLAGT
jgi:pimeloyl-ACP methyl ester carboxylesterase